MPEAIFPARAAVRVKIGKIGNPGNRFSALSTVSGRLTDWQGVALPRVKQRKEMPVGKTRDTEAQRVREKQRETERYGVVKKKHNRPMRFRAHSLTHAARAILMERIVVKSIRRKTGARHECKIAYSWPRLGATAALFAAVPGAHACGQRPVGTAARIMRFRAHSLTHGAREVLTEGIAMEWVRRKMGRRHECKICDSWPGLSDVEGRAGPEGAAAAGLGPEACVGPWRPGGAGGSAVVADAGRADLPAGGWRAYAYLGWDRAGGGTGRRWGLKIPCPLGTCGFESRPAHDRAPARRTPRRGGAGDRPAPGEP